MADQAALPFGTSAHRDQLSGRLVQGHGLGANSWPGDVMRCPGKRGDIHPPVGGSIPSMSLGNTV